IALFSLRSVHEELAQEGPDVTQGTSTGRILVFLGYSGTPVVFGIISYILARPVLDASDAVANASVVRLEPLLLWATFAFSVASCSTIAAQPGLAGGRLGPFLGSGSGRVLPLPAVPRTAAGSGFALLLFSLPWAPCDPYEFKNTPAVVSHASGASLVVGQKLPKVRRPAHRAGTSF